METVYNDTVLIIGYALCGMTIAFVIIGIIQARIEHKRNQDILDRYIDDLVESIDPHKVYSPEEFEYLDKQFDAYYQSLLDRLNKKDD